jgi:predicted anti-sigma-YlaC factor YlaD
MNCETLLQYLSDYIDKNLSEALSDAAQEHLRTCNNCKVVLSSTERMISLYREQGKAREIPEERQKVLYSQLEKAFLEKSAT